MSPSIIAIIILSVAVVSIAVYLTLIFYTEKSSWNNGISPNGKPWKHFNTANDGSRGYTDGENSYIWISLSKVDGWKDNETK